MKKTRINRQFHLALNQKALALYVSDLLQRCSAQTDFAVVQPQLTELQAAAAQFDTRLQEAVAGGRDRVALKNIAKAVLDEKLEKLMLAVELAQLPEEALAQAGFRRFAERRSGQNTEIARPEISSVTALGDGTVKLDFTHADRTRVHTNAFEWSADQGATWNNGAYGKRSGVKLSGLPRRQEALVRMCSVGSYGRRSAWTEPEPVFVL